MLAVYVSEDVSQDAASEAISGHGVVAALGRRSAQVDDDLESIELVEQLFARLAAVREPDEAHGRS